MRLRSSFFNIVTGIGSQIILLFLGFFTRKVFVNIMGLEILGINGLFTSIISMLSLAELGVGGALYYSLYKPLATQDHAQVRAIMQLYSKLYKYIALAVAIIGIMLLPFLNLIVTGNVDHAYVQIVYLVFLADSILSYLLAYKKNIISADQKSYVINTVQTAFSIVLQILQVIVIVTTQSYVLFLLIKVVLGVSANLYFYYRSIKMYPYLSDKEKVILNPDTKAEIIKNAKALFVVQIAGYFVFGTDNILISTFVSIKMVGIYSNYLLIIGGINSLIGQVFGGIRASAGNFLVKESLEDSHKIFHVIYFVNFWITSFCTVCSLVLLNPFISLWLGKEALMAQGAVAIIVANFYFRSMTLSIETFRHSAGLYSPYPFFKYWALLEGVINLVLGLLLVSFFGMGIIGIVIATTISTQLTVFVLPWNVYKYVFKMSSRTYYKKYLIYFMSTITVLTTTLLLCDLISFRNDYIAFVGKWIICLVVTNIFIVGVFYRTNEFQYIWNMRKKFLRKPSGNMPSQ